MLFIHLNVHVGLNLILIYKGQNQDGLNSCNAEVGKISVIPSKTSKESKHYWWMRWKSRLRYIEKDESRDRTKCAPVYAKFFSHALILTKFTFQLHPDNSLS